jgi:hypothetical protein
VKVLRRVVACQGDDIDRKKAIDIMFHRIRHLMEILGYSDMKRNVMLNLLGICALLHDKTGKFYSAYSWIVPDRNQTKDNEYFTIS